MRRRRKRGRSLGILVGCVLIVSIGTLPSLASAGEPKPDPAPLPGAGPKPTPPAPTTAPAPIPSIEPTIQPTASDSGSASPQAEALGSDGAGATAVDDAAGVAGPNGPVGVGTPRSLFDVDDVFGVGSPWIDSLATILEDLASAGRSIAADDVPCVVGRCGIPGRSASGIVIALAGILAGLLVITATAVRRSGWIVRQR